jgi:hypothetical protein
MVGDEWSYFKKQYLQAFYPEIPTFGWGDSL